MSNVTPPGSTIFAAATPLGKMPRAMLERTVALNPYIPHLPTTPQIRFLELECLEALYGGAAGGGKSDALLMAALQFVDVPGYSALLMRRTFADLSLPGALMDRAQGWLAGKARPNAQEHRWRFPSGATIQFGYCEHDKDVHRYMSSEFQFIGLDEATQFSERQVRYLFSRLRRRIDIPVPLRYRLASNPGNVGHEFVKRRFITEPGGRVFIPARLTDNPYIDQKQYLRSLEELDPISRAQLLHGDWDAVASGRFRREHFGRYKVVAEQFGQGGEYDLAGRRVLRRECWRMITVDPAATAEQTAKKSDPDYTVIAVWDVTPDGHLIWVDTHRFRLEIPDITPQVEQVYAQWRPQFAAIEAVASNKAVLQHAMRTKMIVRPVSPLGQDKLTRARPAMILASVGKLWLPERAHWLDDVETEMLLFTGDGKTHDDVVDACSYACALLDEYDESGGGVPLTLSGRSYQ